MRREVTINFVYEEDGKRIRQRQVRVDVDSIYQSLVDLRVFGDVLLREFSNVVHGEKKGDSTDGSKC